MIWSEHVFFFLIPCSQHAAWIGVRVWECVFQQEGVLDGGFVLLHWSSGHSDFKTGRHPLPCIHCCWVVLWRAVKVTKLHIFQLFVAFFSWKHLTQHCCTNIYLFLAAYSFRRFKYCNWYFVLIMKLMIDLMTCLWALAWHIFSSKRFQNDGTWT